MVTDNDFIEKERQIRNGKEIWDLFISKFSITDKDTIILFPHQNNNINTIGLKYLHTYIKIRKPEKVFVIYKEEGLFDNILENRIITKRLGEEEIRNLLSYYSLHELGKNFKLVSLVEPFGRFGDKIVYYDDISMDEVVVYGIYGLSKGEIVI